MVAASVNISSLSVVPRTEPDLSVSVDQFMNHFGNMSNRESNFQHTRYAMIPNRFLGVYSSINMDQQLGLNQSHVTMSSYHSNEISIASILKNESETTNTADMRTLLWAINTIAT